MARGSRRPAPVAALATLAAAVELAVVGLAATGGLAPATRPADVPFLAIWVGYGVAAAVVLERRPRSQVGAVLAAIGVIPAVAVGVDHVDGPAALSSALYVVLPVLLLVALPAVFPDGTRGVRARVAGLWGALVLGGVGGLGVLFGYAWLAAPVLLLCVAGGVVALVVHVRLAARVPEPQRTQHLLFVSGFGVAVAVLVIGAVASALLDDEADAGQWLQLVGLWSVPVGVLLAMVLGGLWETDLAIGRRAVQLATAGLTCVVIALLTVMALPGLVPSMTAAAALVVGVAMSVPLVLLAWRRAGRWLYGFGDPLLSEHLDGGSHDELADLVAAAVRSPGARIVAGSAMDETTSAPGALMVPVASDRVLVVDPRRPGESFTRRDREVVERMAARVRDRLERDDLAIELAAAHAALAEQRGREQRRMREALHDEVGPLLVGAEMQARSLRDRAGEGDHATLAEDLHEALRQARQAMRTVLDDGSPRALSEGLVPALQRLAARFTTPEVTVVDDLRRTVDQSVALAAYQIVAEALANVAQHAHATQCDVVVSAHERLEVSVIDDGRGIDPGRPPGVGLASMRGRALELGGELTVESGSGGTEVHLSVPLAKEPP